MPCDACILQAKSIGYSASVSGEYLTTELYQRLGIAEQVDRARAALIGEGERVGAVIARGELEIGFQQMSELLPVPGIAHITPLPPEVQKVSVFSAGVAASSRDASIWRARSSNSSRPRRRLRPSPEAAWSLVGSQ